MSAMKGTSHYGLLDGPRIAELDPETRSCMEPYNVTLGPVR